MFSKQPIQWSKKGLVIRPNPKLSWAQTHCMIPTPQDLGNGLARIYFSGRNKDNQSHIGYAVVDLNDEAKVLDYSTNAVLCPGELGCFDDNGVTPSCVREINGQLHLYYIGWNPGSTVRMHLFGGLAISLDNGSSFQRWSKAPILERSITDPYLNTAPWVVKAGDEYRMYYVSGHSWVHKDLPRYNLKMATSKDGKIWHRQGHVCIDFKNDHENALARPTVVFEDGVWKMWFAHKGDAYRLGYAESEDGVNWVRDDTYANLYPTAGAFDSEMLEYAATVKHKGQHFMFYNGNNYGFDGIGLAIEK